MDAISLELQTGRTTRTTTSMFNLYILCVCSLLFAFDLVSRCGWIVGGLWRSIACGDKCGDRWMGGGTSCGAPGRGSFGLDELNIWAHWRGIRAKLFGHMEWMGFCTRRVLHLIGFAIIWKEQSVSYSSWILVLKVFSNCTCTCIKFFNTKSYILPSNISTASDDQKSTSSPYMDSPYETNDKAMCRKRYVCVYIDAKHPNMLLLALFIMRCMRCKKNMFVRPDWLWLDAGFDFSKSWAARIGIIASAKPFNVFFASTTGSIFVQISTACVKYIHTT